MPNETNSYIPGDGFGERSPYGPRKWDGYHPGVDFSALAGTPIPAASSGEVWYSGYNNGGYGNVVVIKSEGLDGSAYFTLYAHQNGNDMPKVGEVVNAGDVIGQVGSTGRSTGPHLHFEVLKENTPVRNASGGSMGYEADKEETAGRYGVDPSVFDNWNKGSPYGAGNTPKTGTGGQGGPSDSIDENVNA